MSKQKIKIVFVRWRDACGSTTDRSIEDVPEYCDMDSAGIFLHETEESVVMTQDRHTGTSTVRTTLSIPKCNILKKKIMSIEI